MTPLDANMARLDVSPPLLLVNERVNLDDLLNADIAACGIVRVFGSDDVRGAMSVVRLQSEGEMVGCIAGWISDEQ